MSQVAVQINGKTYRMACDEGQEAHLLDLAMRFEKNISSLKGSFGEIGDQRLTVMAAIMVTPAMGLSGHHTGTALAVIATQLHRTRSKSVV